MASKTQSIADVCVIGLGYIGLPTAAFFASTGLQVRGVDLNEDLVAKVNDGVVPFVEPGFGDFLKQVVNEGSLRASTEVVPAKTFIIAVPTPFNDDKTVEDSYVMAAADSIKDHLTGGELVILESTSPPGLTERMADHILDSRHDLTNQPGQESSIYFAHAPERVLPGKIMEEMVSNDRIVGGTTPQASDLAKELYEQFCNGEVLVTDARTAEMAKLTENSFRDVNIAFANELSMICDDLDINVWELIRLANHHPRVNILQPGPGVGGHCIAVDPWFIASAAPEKANLISSARRVNDSKPEYVINDFIKIISTKTIEELHLYGLTFKADIDDLRESPALNIASQIADKCPNYKIVLIEPFIDELPTVFSESKNVTLTSCIPEVPAKTACLLLVDHQVFKDASNSLKSYEVVYDTRGFLSQ